MIYQKNVMGFGNGNMGAVNGARPDGSMDLTSPQSEEFWVGITYGLAANMIQEVWLFNLKNIWVKISVVEIFGLSPFS